MTNTKNYRVIARDTGAEAFDIVHANAYGPGGCGEILMTTQNVSVDALVELAHRHSLTCKKH